MIVMMLYNRMEQEQNYLKELSRECVAYLSEEYLDLLCACTGEKVQELFCENEILDLACMDVFGKNDIALLKDFRKRYAQSDLLLIADSRISPMHYLTPDIRAASLLLHPYEDIQCRQVVKKFFAAFCEGREKQEDKKTLVIENRDGKIVVPLAQIYYVEAREHKVHIRLKNKEYCQYDTLEHILELLPDYFLRCHRSFVINTEHLDHVKLSENTVYMEDDIMIPLSRSYKPKIKEYVYGLRSV